MSEPTHEFIIGQCSKDGSFSLRLDNVKITRQVIRNVIQQLEMYYTFLDGDQTDTGIVYSPIRSGVSTSYAPNAARDTYTVVTR